MTLISPLAKVQRKESSRTVGRGGKPWFIMVLVSLLLFGGICSRLAYLQLVEGNYNQELARSNSIRLAPKAPVRGNIFDRNGKILATTKLAYSVFIWPLAQSKPEWSETRNLLAGIIDIAPEELDTLVQTEGINSTQLIRVARNLTPAQVTAIEEHHQSLDSVEVIIEPVRTYPYGALAPHVLGYTRELTPEELESRRDQGYRLKDVIGKMGLEASLESRLRGEWGGQEILVNRDGQIVEILGERQAKAGEDIVTTLDVDLQKAAQAILGSKKGAIVALDPRDGSVLAMTSFPYFDPNVFSGKISPEKWQEMTALGDPFMNRGIRGFPPASTFKIVTAIAGMESGRYPASTVLQTGPYLAAAGVRFYEWNRAGFGAAGYQKALQWSSNTFFGQIARGIGGETLIDWSRRFGFGSRTGIELKEETPGLIADNEWKQARFKQDWTVGDTINMSIGQGFTTATPLQIAVMFSVPANGGDRVTPHLVQTDNPVKESLNIDPVNINMVSKGLRSVVDSGTGQALKVPELPPAAGKSGTAEAPPGPSHAWFGGYAPYDKPEIVVVAFAENSGGGGGSVAGPMVRDVMKVYFDKKKAKNGQPQ